MGVTIHYRFAQDKLYTKQMLDDAMVLASVIKVQQADKVGISMGILREHPYRLRIQIGGCEPLALGFGSMKHWVEKAGGAWGYESSTLAKSFDRQTLEDDNLMFAAGFCKTQYAESVIEHKWVADILRMVAGRCMRSEVYDEGDYYHTDRLEDAAEAIHGNGLLIDKLTKDLTKALEHDLGFPIDGKKIDKIYKAGETKIKPMRKKKPPFKKRGDKDIS